MTLKVKFADFEMITRSRSVPSAISNRDDLARLSIGLLGVSLSSLQGENDAEPQLDLMI